jgi:hypothetical protein
MCISYWVFIYPVKLYSLHQTTKFILPLPPMAQYLNLIGAAQIPVFNSAELILWQASGLLDGDMCIDSDTNSIVWYNFNADNFTVIPLSGPDTYVKQYPNQSGTLIDTDLIGLVRVIGVFVDGMFSMVTENGTPTPGFSVDVNTTTGEVDPGYPWDNTVAVQYVSFIPPAV